MNYKNYYKNYNVLIYISLLFVGQERMARIEQEEKEEHDKRKRDAERKKQEIEKAEAMAKKRREEDVDDSKMVRETR